MYNAKEMEQVENIIIKKEDAKQLQRFKEEAECKFSTRFLLNHAKSKQNLKLIEM